MRIEKLTVVPFAEKMSDAKVSVELTGREIHLLSCALYRYIAGGQADSGEVNTLYSDVLMTEELTKWGRVDDWTVGKIMEYRNIKKDEEN